MNIRKYISKYLPESEQEVKDKMSFLNFIDSFDDVLTRENNIGHFTSSAIVVNKDRSKILMIYHNIYNSWAWPGGHADGEDDFLSVAVREVKEETGLEHVKVISNNIAAIDVLTVDGHIKNGEFVSSHLHYNLAYLLSADETDKIRICESENSGVKWIPIDKVVEYVSEAKMKPVYLKLIKKIKEYMH